MTSPSPTQHKSNILDPIHDELDPRVWDKAIAPEPKLKREHSEFIYETVLTALDKHGYDGMERWLSLVFTGSLTTYQYSDESDCDVSLFVDTTNFPDWSRAEVIGIMVSECDGVTLPGTPHPMQNFVVPPGITREDLYKPGIRSGYELATDKWIVAPERGRVHDVENEMNSSYTQALEAADKMDRLLRYEPDKAVQYWHQIHKRRQRDMKKGLGDYATSNVIYKMLSNRGLFPQISEVSGEYIAKVAGKVMYHIAPVEARESIEQYGLDHSRSGAGPIISGDGEELPKANYLYNNSESAQEAFKARNDPNRPVDLYEVNVDGLPLEADPYEDVEAAMSHTPIEPQRLTRLSKLSHYEHLLAPEGDGTLCHRHIRIHGRNH